MARNPKKSDGNNTDIDWRSKVHFVEFSFEEENDIKVWRDATSPDWVTCLEQLFDDGWSVKVSPPGQGDDWFVTGQYRPTGEVYSGHSFTVKYPDLEASVMLLFYVITAMLADGKMDGLLHTKNRAWLG